jgi:tetratricopeptide (TPR) repeat protein
MIATTYYETRQYDNARRVLRSAPSTTFVWSDRILCEISEGTYKRGLQVAIEAAKEFPTEPSILGLQAWLLAHQGRTMDAEELLHRARTADPASPYPDIVESEVQLMQCKFKEAATTAAKMLHAYPNRTDLLHTCAEIALHTGDPADTIRFAEQILQLDASRTTAIQIKAMAMARSNNRDEGIALLDDAIQRFPYSAGLRACRGHLRLQEDDAHGARADFDWAIDAAPDAAIVAKTGMGTLAYRAHRHADARYWFKRAVDVQPSSGDALVNLAWSYAVGSSPAELNAAEQYSAEARRYVRDHSRALAVQAVVAFKRGERRKALRLMKSASAAAPRELDIAVNLAMMQRNSGKLADAEATVRVVLTTDPQHTRARIELAAVLLQQRKTEDARAEAEAAVGENPSSGAAWRILAATHIAAKDATSAEAVLRSALVECDESELPEVRIDLSRLLLTSTAPSTRDARLLEAREHLTAALEAAEDHPEALLLRAWSDLKLDRPTVALRSLDRIRDERMRRYALSVRQAALEQRATMTTAGGSALQLILAAVVVLQLAIMWGLRMTGTGFTNGTEFTTLTLSLCSLLLLTILLPRLVGFKVGTMVQAELSKPPATSPAEVIVTPLSRFEMQPALAPLIGVLAYDI